MQQVRLAIVFDFADSEDSQIRVIIKGHDQAYMARTFWFIGYETGTSEDERCRQGNESLKAISKK